jgi:sigma-E factor negative regulatory protein RseA
MNDKDMMLERVSALVDGQLDGQEFDATFDALCTQETLVASWQTYHVVGEILRHGQHTPCRDGADFMARFHARLAAEDAVQAAPLPVREVTRMRPLEAANEPVFRWKLVAGAASLAAVAAISWNWVGGAGSQGNAPQLAQGTPPAAVAAASPPAAQALMASRVVIGQGSAPQVMLRDPRLDALLEAHQQAAGVSQMPAGFLRNATFEGPSR